MFADCRRQLPRRSRAASTEEVSSAHRQIPTGRRQARRRCRGHMPWGLGCWGGPPLPTSSTHGSLAWALVPGWGPNPPNSPLPTSVDSQGGHPLGHRVVGTWMRPGGEPGTPCRGLFSLCPPRWAARWAELTDLLWGRVEGNLSCLPACPGPTFYGGRHHAAHRPPRTGRACP